MSTKYPDSLLKLYAVHLNIIPCRHCNEFPRKHWSGFCAFAPTEYEPEPIEVAYQRSLAAQAKTRDLKDRYSKGMMAFLPTQSQKR